TSLSAGTGRHGQLPLRAGVISDSSTAPQRWAAAPGRLQSTSTHSCRKVGDGQNEKCNFKLIPGLTLCWEKVLDNFNDCNNSGERKGEEEEFLFLLDMLLG
uniref:Uncharacterized protein n=1 Tax=Dromaius novaehollandiae TaxID=8790 RepID=A0A8C4JE12_DRONO